MSEADRIQNLDNYWRLERAAIARWLMADRVANKRPRISASTSQSQPVQQSPQVQQSEPQSRGRTSCAVEEDEGFIPVEEVESDSGSEGFESEEDEEELEADDDGDGDGGSQDEGPTEAQHHRNHQVTDSTPAPSQLGQSNSGEGFRRCNAVAAASGNASGAIPVVLTDPDVLDCPICLDPLSTPIYQCDNGHVTCSSCCSKSRNKCPSCSLPIGSNRCRAMEKLLESLQINCENATFGCKETLIYNKKTEHERTCPHTPCFCPYPSCIFTGSANNLYLHFSSRHAAAPTSFCYNTDFYITIGRMSKHVYLQERHERVLFVLNHDIQGHTSVFDIDCIGSGAFRGAFLYKITAKGVDTCLSVKSVPKVYANWERHIPKRGNRITVPSEFCEFDGSFSLKVCIRKAHLVV